MPSQLEDSSQKSVEQLCEILRALVGQNSSKRKTKAWGHFKIKLNFRDGLISTFEVSDKTIVKVNP